MSPAFLHRVNYFKQLFRTTDISVVGGYHYGNLGDIILGKSIKEFLQNKKISSDLQTIYNWRIWPKRDYAIIGGGAIGYKSCLIEILKQYTNKYHRLVFLGVDFNEENYSLEIIEMLQKAAFISTRSKIQSDKMSKMLNRNDILFFPDLSFSYRIPEFNSLRNNLDLYPKVGRLFINILPLYGKILNNKIELNEQYRKERPEVYANFDLMQANYIKLINIRIEEALDNKMDVFTVPFTPSDRAFSQLMLKNKYINHLNYNANPAFLQNLFKRSDSFLTTRLHATIFAIRAGAKVLPIAYAKKNEDLLTELGWNLHQFYSINDLLDTNISYKIYQKTNDLLISNFEKLSLDGINMGLNKLNFQRN